MLKERETDTVLPSLSKRQRIWWNKHFRNKIQFYKMKEATDWLNWPRKFLSEDRKMHSKKKKSNARRLRNLRRRTKDIQMKADDLIQNGNVRILVDFDVPAEAIGVLGKGLGFIP